MAEELQHMKWPTIVTLIRHAESAYNDLVRKKESLPAYREFAELYDREWTALMAQRELALQNVLRGAFPSKELLSRSVALIPDISLGVSDYDTPITDPVGKYQSETTGAGMRDEVHVPDYIYVSPYLRTRQTLAGIIAGWPELASARQVEEERLREQEHGIRTLFSDWRIYNVHHPKAALYRELEGEYSFRHEGGESQFDVRQRARLFLRTMLRKHSGQHIMIVTHHLSILALMGQLEKWGRDTFVEMNETNRPLNCSVTTYRGNPDLGREGRLERAVYNRTFYT